MADMCWAQSEALRSIANGVTDGGAGAQHGAQHGALHGAGADADDDDFCSSPFDENAHAEKHEQHDAIASLLDALRRSPPLVARALRRSGLLRPKCPVAEQEVGKLPCPFPCPFPCPLLAVPWQLVGLDGPSPFPLDSTDGP